MLMEKNSSADSQPDQGLTDLDQALNHIAAAVANLHEAARYLKNCNAEPLTEYILRAREEIHKSWMGLKEARTIAK